MKVAVFGDVHGNLAALEAVLAEIGREGAGVILCTGDLVNYGPEPRAVVREALSAPTVCVAGNHDRLLARWHGQALAPRPGRDMALEEAALRWTAAQLGAQERRLLGDLPDRYLSLVGSFPLLLVHGSPSSAEEYVWPDQAEERWERLADTTHRCGARIVIMGHTHLPMYRAYGDVHFFNPGSVGWPKDGDPRASYGLIELGSDPSGAPRFSLRRVAYDAEAVMWSIRRAGLPEALAVAIASGRPA